MRRKKIKNLLRCQSLIHFKMWCEEKEEEEVCVLPCWNCSSTICRLDRDTAYWLTCSWAAWSWSTASSLCLARTFSCSWRDSTCRLACWLHTHTHAHTFIYIKYFHRKEREIEALEPGALHGAGGRRQLLVEHRYPAPELALPGLGRERLPRVRVLDLQQVIAETLQLQLLPVLFFASVLQLEGER